MKKSALLCIVLLALLFSSCTNTNDSSITEIPDNSLNESDDSALSYSSENIIYDEFGAGKNTDFQQFIQANPIDASFEEELRNSSLNKEGTVSVTQLYRKYADIWKDELDKSVEVLADLLEDDSEKETVISANNQFLSSLDEEMNMAESILTPIGGNSIGIVYGQKYITAYRKRTFEIKYLSYQKERFIDKKEIEDCISLNFYH